MHSLFVKSFKSVVAYVFELVQSQEALLVYTLGFEAVSASYFVLYKPFDSLKWRKNCFIVKRFQE